MDVSREDDEKDEEEAGEEPAADGSAKRRRAEDGAVAPPASSGGASAPGEFLIATPKGQAKLIDLGGQGECVWFALVFAQLRARG
eukprot:7125443-Alexandrium_andersonii.AAC.1